MELNKEIKQKITKRFLKKLGEPVSQSIRNVFSDLLKGEHIATNIIICGKYIIAETRYYKDGYIHHFLGVSAKNPKDDEDKNYGIKLAVERSLIELITKFYYNRYKCGVY